MPADCVLYTPRTTDLDEVCTILASGKNVATTAFLFHLVNAGSPPVTIRTRERRSRSGPNLLAD